MGLRNLIRSLFNGTGSQGVPPATYPDPVRPLSGTGATRPSRAATIAPPTARPDKPHSTAPLPSPVGDRLSVPTPPAQPQPQPTRNQIAREPRRPRQDLPTLYGANVAHSDTISVHALPKWLTLDGAEWPLDNAARFVNEVTSRRPHGLLPGDMELDRFEFGSQLVELRWVNDEYRGITARATLRPRA